METQTLLETVNIHLNWGGMRDRERKNRGIIVLGLNDHPSYKAMYTDYMLISALENRQSTMKNCFCLPIIRPAKMLCGYAFGINISSFGIFLMLFSFSISLNIQRSHTHTEKSFGSAYYISIITAFFRIYTEILRKKTDFDSINSVWIVPHSIETNKEKSFATLSIWNWIFFSCVDC